jgi:hypothetical protein
MITGYDLFQGLASSRLNRHLTDEMHTHGSPHAQSTRCAPHDAQHLIPRATAVFVEALEVAFF